MNNKEIKNITKLENDNVTSNQNIIKLSEIGTIINLVLNEIGKTIQNFFDATQKALQSEEAQKFLKEFVGFIQGALKFSEIEEKASPILRKHGWFISPLVEDEFLIVILKFINLNNFNQDEIDDKFVKYYSENNFEKIFFIIEKLKNDGIEEKRIKIFNDCLNILRTINESEINAPNIIIPTLLAHIDRLKTDAQEEMQKIKLMPSKKNEILLHHKDHFDELLNIYNIGLEILIQDIFKPSQIIDQEINIKPLTNELYRHKIMHGESLEYGTMPNVIRAFTALEVLSNIHIKIKEMKKLKN